MGWMVLSASRRRRTRRIRSSIRTRRIRLASCDPRSSNPRSSGSSSRRLPRTSRMGAGYKARRREGCVKLLGWRSETIRGATGEEPNQPPYSVTVSACRKPLEDVVREETRRDGEAEEAHPVLAREDEDSRDDEVGDQEGKELRQTDGFDEDDQKPQDQEEDDHGVQRRGRQVREKWHDRSANRPPSINSSSEGRGERGPPRLVADRPSLSNSAARSRPHGPRRRAGRRLRPPVGSPGLPR